MTITELSLLAGSLVTIITFCGICYKGFKSATKQLLTEELAEIKASIHSLKRWNERQQHDIDTGFEEKQLMFKGIRACLKGLHDDLNCNGPVTAAIAEMDEFLLHHAHEGVSSRD